MPPEFFDLFARDLEVKSDRIFREYHARYSRVVDVIRATFDEFWVTCGIASIGRFDGSVLAVDGSMYYVPMGNGGIFYVVRSMAIGSDGIEVKKLATDFDYTPDSSFRAHMVIQRKMEWLEHLAALEAIESGFRGVILIDGSIYGRIVHIPLEVGFIHDRDLMLRYFRDLYRLMRVCEKHKIPIIGISKESRTSFLRAYLIEKILIDIAEDFGLDLDDILHILNLARESKARAFSEIRNRGLDKTLVGELIREYVSRRPDFQLIMNFAKTPGYTRPLILGMPHRWRRYYRVMKKNPVAFLKSSFPISSERQGFLDWALKVLEMMMGLPAIVSFHVLPSRLDTPMRIDVPAWTLGIDRNVSDAVRSEEIKADVSWILEVIGGGYCGVENYNIWLTAVDQRVKISRDVFESLYLSKFEEVIGRSATARGYRRVRFP